MNHDQPNLMDVKLFHDPKLSQTNKQCLGKKREKKVAERGGFSYSIVSRKAPPFLAPASVLINRIESGLRHRYTSELCIYMASRSGLLQFLGLTSRVFFFFFSYSIYFTIWFRFSKQPVQDLLNFRLLIEKYLPLQGIKIQQIVDFLSTSQYENETVTCFIFDLARISSLTGKIKKKIV